MTPQDERFNQGTGAHSLASGGDAERSALAAIAQSELHNRRRRDALISHDLFSDPAWDMLLALYVEHHQQRPIDVAALCSATAAPTTTALRWIGLLIERGLVTHAPPPRSEADVEISLSPHGIEEIERYLRDFLHRERLGRDIAAGFDRR